MLFELKYFREGKAYEYWKIGIAARAGFHSKNFPKTPKDLSDELFEKQEAVPIPEWLREDYEKKLNDKYKRGD